jgi:hypothetical protein
MSLPINVLSYQSTITKDQILQYDISYMGIRYQALKVEISLFTLNYRGILDYCRSKVLFFRYDKTNNTYQIRFGLETFALELSKVNLTELKELFLSQKNTRPSQTAFYIEKDDTALFNKTLLMVEELFLEDLKHKDVVLNMKY